MIKSSIIVENAILVIAVSIIKKKGLVKNAMVVLFVFTKK
jgi:hypothetical protein